MMGVLSSVKNFDRAFAWSFLGFMLAAIFGGITIYTEFFRSNTPKLIVEVLNDTSVLDLKEEVNELKIFYGDVDIKSLNQTLSVLFLRVKNDGGAPILNGYYDVKYPLSIILKEGKFLKSEQTSATNDYLRSSASPTIKTGQKIFLPNVILEQGESYTIKVLTLHSENSSINFDIIGKIAGVKNIRISKILDANEEIPFWKKVFSGDIFVQIVRFPAYFFVFLLLMLVFFLPIFIASNVFTKSKRKKIIKQYKVYKKDEINEKHELIFDAYINHGHRLILETKDILSNPKKLRKTINMNKAPSRIRIPKDSSASYNELHPSTEYLREHIANRSTIYRLLESLDSFSRNEDGTVTPNPVIEEILNEFIDFVNIKES